MNGFFQDLHYSVRRLLAAPGFTMAVTVILGLGIGANSALFATLDRTVIRPLPYAAPSQLVMLWEDFSAFGAAKTRVSPATFTDWLKRARSLAAIAAYAGPRTLDLSHAGVPEEILGQGVTPDLLPLLGVNPLIGRTFNAAEDAPGARVVVLSYALWQRRFQGDPHLVGQAILLNGEEYDVIGVMPKGFQFPDRQSELWVPLGLTPQLLARRNSHFLHVIGRLRQDRSIHQAQEEMTTVAGELAREYPATNARIGSTVVPLKDEFLGDTRSALILLLASAGCVLLIACANIGNLLLARSAARQKEVAVRIALGASPGRVLRQLLTENILLAGAGGATGLLFAKWILIRLEAMIPPGLAAVDMNLDWRTIAVTAGISIITGLLFGMAPASKLLRSDISNPLQEASRGNVAQAGSRVRDALVVAEIGLALVLVVGAVLLIQTLMRLRSFDAGFQAKGILTAQINAPIPRYQDATTRQNFYSELLEKAAALPGVEAAGLTSDLPYTSRGNTMGLVIEGRPPQVDLGADALFRLVSPGYLETIGARLHEGRLLDSRDQMDTLAVVVVNETLARQYWPNETAIGKRIDTGTGDGTPKWMTVVGVVRDVRERGLDLANKGAVYVPFTQTTIGFFLPSEIALRTSRDPLALSKELQQAVWSVDPEQPVSRIATMESIVDAEFANRTQVLRLLGAFAVLALVLAAFGIYGVLSYVVSLRTREIGLRMAIGASHWDIVREMFFYSFRLIAAGVGLGLVSAVAATRLLSSLLFGVSALDPITFGGVCAGLAVVGLFASWIPLIRASRVDPMTALRLE